jgi:hypothetical protein
LRCGGDAHDGCADDQGGDVLRDGADYGTENAEGGAANENPAAAEDVGNSTDDGESYGGGESIGEGDPDDVGVL